MRTAEIQGWREVPPVEHPDVGVRADNTPPGTPLDSSVSESLRDHMYGRDTGHFGTGIYFLSSPEAASKMRRPHIRGIDLSGKNLYRPRSNKDGYGLHDDLATLNSLANVGAYERSWEGHWGDQRRISIESLYSLPGWYTDEGKQAMKDAIDSTYADIQANPRPYGQQAGHDTASTRYMKAMGYDGIDVRHLNKDADSLSGLDNSEYGSVLYRPQGAQRTASKDELHVALSLPDQIASKIREWADEQDWPEGTELEPKADYHITLLYVSEGHEEHHDADWLPDVDGFDVEVTGVDEFGEGDSIATVLRLDCPEADLQANDLQDMAENRELPLSRFPGGYKPHITVAYGPHKPAYVRAPKLKFKTGPSEVSTPREAAAEEDWLENWKRNRDNPDYLHNIQYARCPRCQRQTMSMDLGGCENPECGYVYGDDPTIEDEYLVDAHDHWHSQPGTVAPQSFGPPRQGKRYDKIVEARLESQQRSSSPSDPSSESVFQPPASQPSRLDGRDASRRDDPADPLQIPRIQSRRSSDTRRPIPRPARSNRTTRPHTDVAQAHPRPNSRTDRAPFALGSRPFGPRIAAMTLPQEQRAWKKIRAEQGSDPGSQVVHTFPDGWTVQHHPTFGDVNSVGLMMRNCWQGIRALDPSKLIPMENPNGPTYARYAIHDEHDIPRAAFFRGDNYFPNEGSFFTQALAARNGDISQDDRQRLVDYGHASGVDYYGTAQKPLDEWLNDSAWGYPRRQAAATRFEQLQWARDHEQEHGPDTSHVVHRWPDGWSVRRPASPADYLREGAMMGNCVGDLAVEADQDKLTEPYPHSWQNYYSLRDPDNLPHATWQGWDDKALGKHNSPVNPKYTPYLDDYGIGYMKNSPCYSCGVYEAMDGSEYCDQCQQYDPRKSYTGRVATSPQNQPTPPARQTQAHSYSREAEKLPTNAISSGQQANVRNVPNVSDIKRYDKIVEAKLVQSSDDDGDHEANDDRPHKHLSNQQQEVEQHDIERPGDSPLLAAPATVLSAMPASHDSAKHDRQEYEAKEAKEAGQEGDQAAHGQDPSIPSEQELAPFRARGECYEWSQAVENKWPHLKRDAGFYVRPRAGAGDHAWNVAPDGTIVDTTSAQFRGPMIVPPGHPHYKRYVSWDNEPQAQSLAHDLGYHYEGAENPDSCPKCAQGDVSKERLPQPRYDADLGRWVDQRQGANNDLRKSDASDRRGSGQDNVRLGGRASKPASDHDGLPQPLRRRLHAGDDRSALRDAGLSGLAQRQAASDLHRDRASRRDRRSAQDDLQGQPQGRVMYHIAPAHARDDIQQQGLQFGGDDRIYMSPQPSQAYLSREPGQLDVWKVNTEGIEPKLGPSGEDWDGVGEYYVDHPIPPERLTLVQQGNPELDRRMRGYQGKTASLSRAEVDAPAPTPNPHTRDYPSTPSEDSPQHTSPSRRTLTHVAGKGWIDRHVPRLCYKCNGPLTHDGACTRCSKRMVDAVKRMTKDSVALHAKDSSMDSAKDSVMDGVMDNRKALDGDGTVWENMDTLDHLGHWESEREGVPTSPWSEIGVPIVAAAEGSLGSHIAMAERSGIPELDQAIEEFMQTEFNSDSGHGPTTTITDLNEYRSPDEAHGNCEIVAESLARFLNARGFKAYATSDELTAFPGYEQAQLTEQSYPEHAMVEVYHLPGMGIRTVTIDFTASQYGFTEFPKVHISKSSSVDHKLWWEPGVAGRGFILDDGSVHTWPESEATHHERAYALNLNPRWAFHIRPDGTVARAYQESAPNEQINNTIESADPRLKVHPTMRPEFGFGYKSSSVNKLDLPPEQQAIYGGGGSYRQKQWRQEDLERNPVPGTHIWRGEVRTDLNPESVGMHWTVSPDVVLKHVDPGRYMPGGENVVWQGVMDSPSQALPRSHPIFQGRSRPMSWEGEVRLKPGPFRLNGAYTWEGEGNPGTFYPINLEHHDPGWQFHPLDYVTQIAHRPLENGINYDRFQLEADPPHQASALWAMESLHSSSAHDWEPVAMTGRVGAIEDDNHLALDDRHLALGRSWFVAPEERAQVMDEPKDRVDWSDHSVLEESSPAVGEDHEHHYREAAVDHRGGDVARPRVRDRGAQEDPAEDRARRKHGAILAALDPSPINQAAISVNPVGRDLGITDDGSNPFIFDRGTNTIHLGPQGSRHGQIFQWVGNKMQGPTYNGWHDGYGIEYYDNPQEDERNAIQEALRKHTGKPLSDEGLVPDQFEL